MAVFYDLTTRCPWSPSYTTTLDSSTARQPSPKPKVSLRRKAGNVRHSMPYS
jgi:hypothetical protein